MKIQLLVLLICCILSGCSSDEGSGRSAESRPKFLTDMIVAQGGGSDTFEFQYDDINNISSIHRNGEVEYQFIYNVNKLSSIHTYGDSEPWRVFNYTEGVLKTYSDRYGDDYPISYQPAGNTYFFSADNFSVTLKDKDILRIENIGGEKYFSMEYDTAIKGPLFNIKTENTFLFTLMSELYPFLFHNAAKNFYYNGTLYTCENSYDEDNYLIKMQLNDSDGTQYTIHYIYNTF